MLSVTVQNTGDAAVLHYVGRIVAGEDIRTLRDTVMCQVHKRAVAVDLARVDAIDAAGLGELIFLRTLAAVAGNELKLINPTERVRELLALTKLDSVFELRSSGDGQLLLGEAAQPSQSQPRYSVAVYVPPQN